MKQIENKELSRSDAEIELLLLAKFKSYTVQRMIRAINNMLQRLPTNPIKDTDKISENELLSTYFDPLLSSIIADPEKNILLQWLNRKTDKNDNIRPDATITDIKQLSYGHNLGHGEGKAPGSDNHALTHDLLRISILSKDSLDYSKLAHVLSFQIIGFTVVFYLMSLEFNGIYTQTEIARLNVPRSVCDLTKFISLKNLHLLVKLCEMFWTHCKIAAKEDLVVRRYAPALPTLYDFIDVSRNKHRTCSLRFEH